MSRLCRCGHARSQHPDNGVCDYHQYSCLCTGYKRAPVEDDIEGERLAAEATCECLGTGILREVEGETIECPRHGHLRE